MNTIEKIKNNKIVLLILSVLLFSNFFVINLKAQESITPAAANDMASSSATRFPVTYNSTTGTPLFNDIGQYKFKLFGNSNTVGYDEGNATSTPFYKYIDKDSDPSTFNSTSMDYQMEGTVKKAYLYIAQSYDVVGLQNANPTRNSTFIEGPSGAKFYFDDGYQDAYYDITEFIKQEGSGTYWGKNIENERVQQATRDNFANWEIVVVEEDPSYNYRQISLQGFNLRMLNTTRTLDASSTPFAMPATNITGQALLSAGGGNSTIFSGSAYINSLQDGTQIGQEILPTGVRGSDLLQGRITSNGIDLLDRNPNRIPANIDLLTQDLDSTIIADGSNNLQLQLTTANDAVFLHILGIAADVGTPDISIESYVNTLGSSSAYFKMGDSIEITNTVTANPLEDTFYLNSPVVSIQLPVGTEYLENSVISLNNPISNVVYDSNTRELKVYFTNTITNDTFDFSYEIKSSDGVKVSDITTSLSGYNEVQNVVTGLSLTYNSNSVSLYPSYPVIVNHIDERTGNTLLQENLTGLYNDSFTATTTSFTGLSFNPNANNSSLTGTFTDDHQVVNLYYMVNLYMMNFDVNKGDSENPVSQEIAFETLATQPTTPKRNGYTFIGWNTLADGSGITWDFANTTMPANDVTLYAQWEKNVDPIVDYTLRFDLNGGQGNTPANQTLNEGQKAVKPTNPTREGYTFNGWNTAKDGSGTAWNFKTDTMPANDVTLYAQWTENDLPITGDSSNAILFSTLLILAGISMIVVSKKRYVK